MSNNVQQIELKLKLFPHHLNIVQTIIKEQRRYNILCSSRQYGKSTLAIEWMVYCMLSTKMMQGLYITPQFPLARVAYKKMVDKLGPQLVKTANKAELTIEFVNGSLLMFKSATNEEAIRGLQAHYIVVDEFSFIPNGVFESVIRPTGNVIGKQYLLVSTPKGKNLFYEMYIRGKTGSTDVNYLSFKAHYTDNPAYNLAEVEDARRVLPLSIFNQEYEGDFLDDGGSVFPDIKDILQDKYAPPDKLNYMGVDLGRRSDYAVLWVLNNKGQTVHVYRQHKQNWSLIKAEIINILNKYHGKVVIEINGIGDPLFEDIHTGYKNSEPFLTTNDSKNMLIEELILAMNDHKITLPDNKLLPSFHDELGVFSFTYSPKTRKIYYGAKTGWHDDMIMALAMANHCRKHSVTSFRIVGNLAKNSRRSRDEFITNPRDHIKQLRNL